MLSRVTFLPGTKEKLASSFSRRMVLYLEEEIVLPFLETKIICCHYYSKPTFVVRIALEVGTLFGV